MAGVMLCGRAGAGKTHQILDSVRALAASHDRAGRFVRFQVLVPTYSRAEHLKRRLIRGRGGASGLFDRGIGTFEQLAERETGRHLHELTSAAVQDELLLAALRDVDAPVFRGMERYAGFRRAALRFAKEIKSAEPEAGVGAIDAAAERLTGAAQTLPRAEGRRLDALARVLVAYQTRLTASGGLDHEDLLAELLAHLRAHPPADLAFFALDGFSDLTEVQERIVQCLAGAAHRSVAALLADPGGREDGPFGASAPLRRRLMAGSGFAAQALPGNQRAVGDLVRLEHLLAGDEPGDGIAPDGVAPDGVAPDGVAPDGVAPDGRVRFLAGADPEDEAERVARTCRRFIADGVPPRDVLVIVRRIPSATAGRIARALERHDVPARVIGGTSATARPVVRHALRVLRLLVGAGSEQDRRDALAAGDARGVEPPQAERLRAEADLRERDRERLKSAERDASDVDTCDAWLARLAELSLPAEPRAPGELSEHLATAIPELLALSFEGAVSDADAARARADAAAYKRVLALLRQSAAALHAAGVDAALPALLVERTIERVEAASFAVLDRRVDVVSVIDAEEARQWEARAVVVAGLRMGEFPVVPREDLFVSDPDRRELTRRAGVRLPGRVDAALRRERLLFYAAVTRAREWLVLTAPVADEKGDRILPSPFLTRALGLLPEGQRELEGAQRTPGDVRAATGETFGVRDLVHASLSALTERFHPGGASQVRAHSGVEVVRRLIVPAAESGLNGGRRGLLVHAARAFLAAPPHLRRGGAGLRAAAEPRERSPSGLASFAQCPYKHFAGRILRLRSAEAWSGAGLEPSLAGDVIHRVLELAIEEGKATPGDAEALLSRAWAELVGASPSTLAEWRDRGRLVGSAAHFLEDGGLLADGYLPHEQEWGFGGRAHPTRVGDVPVRGRVDRIDANAAGRAVVVDYKWSAKSRLSSLASDLRDLADLQLPLYALAIEARDQLDVVACGWVTLREPGRRWLRLHPTAPKAGRADIDWSENAAERLDAVRAEVRLLDDAIRTGDIATRPRDDARCGRGHCDYADLCRYDGGGA